MRMSRVRDENLYGRWTMMKQRCLNPNNHKYKNYGARGIKVCDEWMDYYTFKKWALENGFEEHLTIDRVDTNGDYEPGNCRWVDYGIQANNRRNNVTIAFEGKDYTLAELSDKTGVKSETISLRLNKGWTPEEAVHRPLNYDHILVEIDGEKQPLKKWCESLSLPYKTIYARIKRGWEPKRALSTPVRKGNYRRNDTA